MRNPMIWPIHVFRQEKRLVEIFDTVLFAVGRTADTAGLDLAKAGVVADKWGKFESDVGQLR